MVLKKTFAGFSLIDFEKLITRIAINEATFIKGKDMNFFVAVFSAVFSCGALSGLE